MRKVMLSLLVSFLLVAATSAQMGVVGAPASLESGVPASPPERSVPSPWPPGPREEADSVEANWQDASIRATQAYSQTFGYWHNWV